MSQNFDSPIEIGFCRAVPEPKEAAPEAAGPEAVRVFDDALHNASLTCDCKKRGKFPCSGCQSAWHQAWDLAEGKIQRVSAPATEGEPDDEMCPDCMSDIRSVQLNVGNFRCDNTWHSPKATEGAPETTQDGKQKILDVMHTLSVIAAGRARDPKVSAQACWDVLNKVLERGFAMSNPMGYSDSVLSQRLHGAEKVATGDRERGMLSQGWECGCPSSPNDVCPIHGELKAEGAEKDIEAKRPTLHILFDGMARVYDRTEADELLDALESRNAELQSRCDQRFDQLADIATQNELLQREVERLKEQLVWIRDHVQEFGKSANLPVVVSRASRVLNESTESAESQLSTLTQKIEEMPRKLRATVFVAKCGNEPFYKVKDVEEYLK